MLRLFSSNHPYCVLFVGITCFSTRVLYKMPSLLNEWDLNMLIFPFTLIVIPDEHCLSDCKCRGELQNLFWNRVQWVMISAAHGTCASDLMEFCSQPSCSIHPFAAEQMFAFVLYIMRSYCGQAMDSFPSRYAINTFSSASGDMKQIHVDTRSGKTITN